MSGSTLGSQTTTHTSRGIENAGNKFKIKTKSENVENLIEFINEGFNLIGGNAVARSSPIPHVIEIEITPSTTLEDKEEVFRYLLYHKELRISENTRLFSLIEPNYKELL
eukprot:TRINITY_DN223_c0_g1_i1.p1 TRINITY_DN223_c0_g1~~TRINITY_DN223_c0_g1_i1.p1  ORF type:complete len:110 (+),score=19.49 TRINITY_DN223_c0_g1_i1:54-383(+)